MKKAIKIILLSVLFIIILGYAFFQTRDLIYGVKLSLHGITDGMTAVNPALEITGQAAKIKNLSINGEEIFIGQTGNFKTSLILSTGYNIVTVTAVDRFNKTTTKTFRVIYSPNQ